jgi:hypothetical protein
MEMLERDHDFNVQQSSVMCKLEEFIFGSMALLDLVSINEKNNRNSLEPCELYQDLSCI